MAENNLLQKEGATFNWETSEIKFNSDPLVEVQGGKPVILRMFTFKFDPKVIQKGRKPSKQMLFNTHVKQIRDFLWKDGLKAREDINPRVTVGEKGYTFYIASEPKLGVTLADKPMSLNDVLGNPNQPK